MTATVASGREERRAGRGSTGGFLAYLTAGAVVSIIFVAPLAWALVRSFQASGQLTSAPSGSSFHHFTVSNFVDLLTGDQVAILRNVVNSIVVSVATAAITAVVATLAGYGFGRFRFRGSGAVFALILMTMMVPFQALLTPLFLELHDLHLTNSLAGLVVFYTTFNLPFGVYVMTNTFREVPQELVDSAKVDGASVMTTLLRVLRPLVIPGVATTVLYAFLFSWTEFLGALTFLTSDSKYTLQVALLAIETGTYGQVNFGYLIAGAVIAMVPCVVLYVSLQRYYIKGLISGAVKG